MSGLSRLYEKVRHRPAPVELQRAGPLMLVWKIVRKWLCVSVIPFIPFNTLRIWGYRLVGFRIGRHVFIGMQCYLDDVHPDLFVVEDDVVISYRVTVSCHGPRTDNHRLVLKEGSYIGTSATLLGGLPRGDVVIGPYATVGACALVHRSVPPLATVAGVPARILRTCRQPWASDDGRLEELAARYLANAAPAPRIVPEGDRVRIECDQADGLFLRYTLDGTDPTEDSPCAHGPVPVPPGAELRVRAFRAGHRPGEVVVHRPGGLPGTAGGG